MLASLLGSIGALNPARRIAAGAVIAYLWRDEFITDTPSLSTTRVSEPGPGNVTFGNIGSSTITGSELVTAASASSMTLTAPAQTKAVGVAFVADFRRIDSPADRRTYFGFESLSMISLGNSGSSDVLLVDGGSANIGLTLSQDVQTKYMVVLTSFGWLAFKDSTLIWVSRVPVTPTTVRPTFLRQGSRANIALNSFRCLNLGLADSRFSTDYGLATTALQGNVSEGAAFTHTADCVLEFNPTTIPTADTIDIWFRQQDANNGWLIRIASSRNLQLFEMVAGVLTSRVNVATAVTAGQRVEVHVEGSTIRLFTGTTLRATYASATNFQTATNGMVSHGDGAVADMIAWPRTVTLPAI
ncbi:hypothetical protein EON83_10925 [bacterium]|nr:MAG: hypothetical protein EON83_10925 [bacterium]